MADLAIASRDLPSGLKKGEIASILETPRKWGRGYTPDIYIKLRITDRTKAQVNHFLNDWPLVFVYETKSENINGWRIEISVDPDFIDASGIARSKIKQAMRDYIDGDTTGLWAGASTHSFSSDSMQVDIPKVNLQSQAINDLANFKTDFKDKFNGQIAWHRYHFSEQSIDDALAQGDKIIEMTGQQALFFIIDKLDL